MPAESPDLSEIRSVVVVRALSGIGDILCAIPALRALRAGLPGAHVAVVGLPSAGVVLERFPCYLDELVAFPGFPGLPEGEADVSALPGFFAAMQERRFDLSLQLQGSGTAANPFTALLAASRTAGFHLPGQFRPSDLSVPYPADVHEIRRLLAVTSRLGLPEQGEDLEWPLFRDDHADLDGALRTTGARLGRYAVLHAGAEQAQRRWPEDRFARIAERLAEDGLTVVLTGTASDAPVTRAVAEAASVPVVDLAGRTSLGAFGALLAGARLVVTNDTGASHLAAALHVPSVVVFSDASDPRRWAPLDGALHRAVHPFPAGHPLDEHGGDVNDHCLRDGCRHFGVAEGAGSDPTFVSVADVLSAVDAQIAGEAAHVA